MKKGIKFRAYPNKGQQNLINRTLMGFDDDCVREVKQMATTRFKEISENLVTLP